MSEFKIGDKVRCIRGVEGSQWLKNEPLKTGVCYVIREACGDDVYVEGILPGYKADRFVKEEP